MINQHLRILPCCDNERCDSNAPISWKAKRQDCVTLSSAEAEYVAASMAGQEVVYLHSILSCFGHEQLDNTECIQISLNLVNCKFTRHIDVQRYYALDLVTDSGVMVLPVPDRHADGVQGLLHDPGGEGTRGCGQRSSVIEASP
eukprot:2528766-Rhodomonas_salina.1